MLVARVWQVHRCRHHGPARGMSRGSLCDATEPKDGEPDGLIALIRTLGTRTLEWFGRRITAARDAIVSESAGASRYIVSTRTRNFYRGFP